jgi:leukotriene-A4 hydrolase
MESLFDTKLDFENLIRYYINKHSQMSVTYLDFKQSLEEWVDNNYNATRAKQIKDTIDWNSWVHQPGANPPNNNLNFTTEGAQTFEALADAYIALGGSGRPSNYQIFNDTKDPQLKVIFLSRLMDRANSLNYKIMSQIDSDYKITNDPNPELGQRWFPLSIQLKYEIAYDAAKAYVSRQGRMKYILPVYTALV